MCCNTSTGTGATNFTFSDTRVHLLIGAAALRADSGSGHRAALRGGKNRSSAWGRKWAAWCAERFGEGGRRALARLEVQKKPGNAVTRCPAFVHQDEPKHQNHGLNTVKRRLLDLPSCPCSLKKYDPLGSLEMSTSVVAAPAAQSPRCIICPYGLVMSHALTSPELG